LNLYALISRVIARFKDIWRCFSYLFIILLHFALILDWDQDPNECPAGSVHRIFFQLELCHEFEGESLNNSGWKGPLEVIRSSLSQVAQSLVQLTEVNEAVANDGSHMLWQACKFC